MNFKIKKSIRIPLEMILYALFLCIINFFFPENPGFFNGVFNPYIALALVLAVYYGKYYSYLNFLP